VRTQSNRWLAEIEKKLAHSIRGQIDGFASVSLNWKEQSSLMELGKQLGPSNA
jgi:hypothetical protein